MISSEKKSALLKRLEALMVTGHQAGHERHLNLKAIKQLKEGHEKATFGYHTEVRESEAELLAIMAGYTGCSPDFTRREGSGYLAPEATLQGLWEAAQTIGKMGKRQARVVVATGHTGGMTAYYLQLIALLERWGCQVLESVAAGTVVDQFPCPHCGQHMVEVRLDYIGKLVVLSDGEVLRHTHAAEPMRLLLAALKETDLWPDLVVADHGFAGAALKENILTIAVMDTNDPGLALAKKQGAPLILIPMDDNRANYLTCQVVDILDELVALCQGERKMEKSNWQIGDFVKMRKQHPCGGFIWEILRVGMDFRIKCATCERVVLLPRSKFEKQVKEKVEKQS